MGLDKWLKPEDVEKKSKKKKESVTQTKKSEKQSIKFTKYMLICPDAKCKYQKIIMKKQLTDDDKTCPRCNKKMKTKAV